ncbi:hypothetical protein C8Q75DRAFT_199986 [Abortiporus biennis]|nr:hypothetical protein C8Q75DRAFT_199986 [Abortiporus biennis]
MASTSPDTMHHFSPDFHDESEDEEFVYPGAESEAEHVPETNQTPSPVEEQRVVPSTPIEPDHVHVSSQASTPEVAHGSPIPVQPISNTAHPTPAQLEALHTAASSGNLKQLQSLFKDALQNGELEAFALSNDASPRTGLTVLHAAASRGYLNIVKWLIEECGAMPDIEDKEGEVGPISFIYQA